MRYIKEFEAKKTDEDREKDVTLLDDLIKENPISKTHDFYIFIGRDSFIEDKDGLYKKSVEIENMVKITSDKKSISAIQGLEMRARFNPESSLYHIWLPKDLEDEIEGKGSNSIEPWLVDLINKYKQKGSDDQGRKVFKDVSQRRSDMNTYNL